jgi:hypothetical protein
MAKVVDSLPSKYQTPIYFFSQQTGGILMPIVSVSHLTQILTEQLIVLGTIL